MSGIKYLIVGCAGGIGLSLLIIFFQDAMSTRLQDAGELKKKFGLRYLGRIPAAQGKNTHRFEAVDRWICRLEGKDYEHINETEAIKNICIHTKYALMQQGGELSVLLKGILEPSLLEVLQRELSSLGISAFYDSVISNNIQNQDMFSHCGNVILVKNRNCSVLETEHEIALIREYAGVILGYIMV